MRLKPLKISVAFCFFLSFLSCGDDDREECIGYENAPITEVSGPSTAVVGETVSFELDFYMRNGCGSFERIVENTASFSRIVAVEAKYEGCVCTAILLPGTVDYEFTPEEAGDYELHFRTVSGDYIVRSVTAE